MTDCDTETRRHRDDDKNIFLYPREIITSSTKYGTDVI